MGVQRDLHALRLARDWSGIDVVLAVGGRASVEVPAATGLELAAAGDGKAAGGRGTRVALKLGGWRRQDAAAAVAVRNLTVVDTVRCRRAVAADPVLAIGKLADGAGSTS